MFSTAKYTENYFTIKFIRNSLDNKMHRKLFYNENTLEIFSTTKYEENHFTKKELEMVWTTTYIENNFAMKCIGKILNQKNTQKIISR